MSYLDRQQFRDHLKAVARKHMPKRRAAAFAAELDALGSESEDEPPCRRSTYKGKRGRRSDQRQGRLL
jgi:hypothetical protein